MGYFGSLLISIDFAWIVSRIWLDIDAYGTGPCQGHRVKLALIWQASFVINCSQFYAHRSVIGWTKRPVDMSFGHLQLSSWCWSWITIGIICWQLSLCLARDVASVGNNATKVLTFLSSTQLQSYWGEPLLPLQKVFVQWNGFSISEVRTKKFVAMTNLKCQQRQPQPSVIASESSSSCCCCYCHGASYDPNCHTASTWAES